MTHEDRLRAALQSIAVNTHDAQSREQARIALAASALPQGSPRMVYDRLFQFLHGESPVTSEPPEDEQDSCEEERMRLALYDREHLAAAKAIKESDHWADNHWPSTVDRIWYVEAQKEIARLRESLNWFGRLRRGPSGGAATPKQEGK